jgi:hypothetical protein
MVKVIRYDLYRALKQGVSISPSKDIQGRGMNIIKYEGVPIADCIMIEVDKISQELPCYMDIVDFEFSIQDEFD